MKYTSQEIRDLIIETEEDIRKRDNILFSQARYQIRSVLGEGGMGITCLADELSAANLKRPIVLKFVKNSLAPERLTQFLNEVQLSILFNHPNLLPVFRLESEVLHIELSKKKSLRKLTHEHTIYYAVMQYIDGWNIRQLINRLRNLKILLNHDIVMFIIGRIARGLNYVHEYHDKSGNHMKLVHRDVSPENILIDHFGRIKVSDFGIARGVTHANNETLQHAGNLLYCSPEQLEGKKLDNRSDIYNIGLLMYLFFTNKDLFGLEIKSDRMRERILQKMSQPMGDKLSHISSNYARICEVCLRKDPSERYQSCEDLANDIDIYMKERQIVVNNEQLEEVLNDMFSANPCFTSRRFISLSGSDTLLHPKYDPNINSDLAEPIEKMVTIKLNDKELDKYNKGRF